MLVGERDLLFEIGCEEIPAADLPSALQQLAALGRQKLAEARLPARAVRALGTPRRLVLHAQGVPERQAEERQWVRGPSEKAAFTPDGRPTPAALGFARSRGVPVERLQVRETPQGRYVMVEVLDPGRPAVDVLAEVLPAIAGAIEFPKTMRWGAGDFRFSRPIRWVVALLGEDVVPCEVAGVRAGRRTSGHRFLAPGPLEVSDPDDYFRKMDAAFVVVDPAERRQLVVTGAEAVARQAGGRARVTEALVEEVTNLVEFPTPFVGRFDEAFLELPEAVLETTMRVHQRYFPVEGPDGRLLNRFVGVRNGDRRALERVAAGNERVLRARLADARFFYQEDRKRRLEERIPDLKRVTFLAELGSLYDKTERLVRLVRAVSAELGLSALEAAERAAWLSKTDLLTHVVYEFPELEGVMGEHYARLEGEPEAVARALSEQYLPRGAGGPVPETEAGIALAVADKLDNLAAGFLTGRQPTGSQDPFGLRRQAIGLLRILRRRPQGASVRRLLQAAVAALPSAGEGVVEDILRFLEGRLRVQMQEEGLRHDVVEAALAGGWDDVARAWWTAESVQRALSRPDLEAIVTVFRRAANLAKGGQPPASLAGPWPDEEEARLAAALRQAEERAAAALAAGDDAAYFDAVAALRPAVDRFLERVLVMAPEAEARARRLGLLAAVTRLAGRLGDLGRLAVSAES
ncbi:MAG: glycine--tRNA ligase subunit beta [Firmicutes bacterium]|nr:glycine--tRNA ligase subunit beta [Bacillota bacterium]